MKNFFKIVLIIVVVIAVIGFIADTGSKKQTVAGSRSKSVNTAPDTSVDSNNYNEQALDLKNAVLSKANMTLAKVSQEKIDELTKKVEELEAEAKYFEAMTLIESEPEKCEAYIILYERVAVEYAYYIIYSGTESKANAFYILSLAREYCGEYATIIDITEEDIAGMESTYSEKEAIEKAGGELNTPASSKQNTADNNNKTSYELMMDFVTEKPGKWGDIDWCELYTVCFGDPPENYDATMFMIKKGTCEADTEYIVYVADAEKDEVYIYGTFGTGHSEIYENPEYGQYYRVYGNMGYGAVYSIDRSYNGDKFEGIAESVYIPEREVSDYSELIENGWRRLEGMKLSELN